MRPHKPTMGIDINMLALGRVVKSFRCCRAPASEV